MNIIVYSLMTYGVTAIIAFAVIGVVVLMAKALDGQGDAESN